MLINVGLLTAAPAVLDKGARNVIIRYLLKELTSAYFPKNTYNNNLLLPKT